MNRFFRFLLLLAATWLLPGAAFSGNPPLDLVDLNGQRIDPFQQPKTTASAFLFVRTDCPISNAYAPEIRRLHEKYASRGVAFWLVYLDRDEAPAAIRKHVAEYQYPCGVLRDSRHALAKACGARVTPEAAVYSAQGKLVFVGRIDDRYVAFGKSRPEATTHDLDESLTALLAGRPVPRPAGPAIGCFIEDLK
ncbi:MAG: hypothetical protein QOE70_5907 [Chthoniobacter sp.]|jgi:hypothetical protein|nr:hypothetical protein [Chthoniobacter sp.]